MLLTKKIKIALIKELKWAKSSAYVLVEGGDRMLNKSKRVPKTEEEFAKLRERMVKEQIYNRGVRDQNVLEAMRKVPRHKFVPKSELEYAYNDSPLPIGHNQTISQPYIVALMTEKLELDETSKVLEIGTGSGYQTAILAEIAQKVYTIEIIKELAESVLSLFDELGYENIIAKHGNGYLGLPEYAPFYGIIVTAAPKDIPQTLIEQLKIGGRMVIPVGNFYQELVIIKKTEEGLEKENIVGVRFVPMTGKPIEN